MASSSDGEEPSAIALSDERNVDEINKALLDEAESSDDESNELQSAQVVKIHPQQWIHSLFRMRAITVSLFAGFFSLGITLAVLGPTLLDLACNTSSTLKQLSYVFTARSVGYLTGSILGGVLFDRFEGHFLVSISQTFSTIGTFLIPLGKQVGVLALCVVFEGIAMGFLDTGGNVMLLQLWRSKSAPYLQALHFAFGLGAFISPLMAEPFLINTANSSDSFHNHRHFEACPNSGNSSSNSRGNVSELCGSNYKPTFGASYYIAASFLLVTAVGFVYYAFRLNVCRGGSSRRPTSVVDAKRLNLPVSESDPDDGGETSEESEKWKSDTRNYANASRSYVYQILALLFFFYFAYIGIEVTYGGFVASYAVCHLGMSKSTAAFLTSVYWGTFAVGRGLGVLFASLKVSPATMVVMDFFGCLAAVAILVAFPSSAVALWCGTALLGLAIASIFPATISWAELYIEISGKRASVFVVGASFGEMVIPLVTGNVFAVYGPTSFLYSILASSLVASLLFVALWFRAVPSRLARFRRRSFSPTTIEMQRRA